MIAKSIILSGSKTSNKADAGSPRWSIPILSISSRKIKDFLHQLLTTFE